MDSPILKFRLPADKADAIQKLADEHNVSVSDIIRICIARALPYAESYLKAKQVSPAKVIGPAQ